MNTNIKNILILIIRLVAGGMLAYAGYNKLTDMNHAVNILGGLTGLSAGFAWAVALGELATGLGLIFGIWTKLAAAGALIIMIGAVYYTNGQSTDAILLLIGSAILAAVGGGKWALVTNHPKDKIIVAHSTADLPKF